MVDRWKEFLFKSIFSTGELILEKKGGEGARVSIPRVIYLFSNNWEGGFSKTENFEKSFDFSCFYVEF